MAEKKQTGTLNINDIKTPHQLIDVISSQARAEENGTVPARLTFATLARLFPENTPTELKQTLGQLNTALSLALTRARENSQTASHSQVKSLQTGIRSLVDGPDYDSLFSPNYINSSQPGSMEDPTAAVRYLYELYQRILQLENEAGDKTQIIPLQQRRRDIIDMTLDAASFNETIPQLKIINRVLERFIRNASLAQGESEQAGERSIADRGVEDALLKAFYPLSLPFERYQQQINYVLDTDREQRTGVVYDRQKYSLGDLVRQSDVSWPWFKLPGLTSGRTAIAQEMDTFCGPVQLGLLTSPAIFATAAGAISAAPLNGRAINQADTKSEFYEKYYGVSNSAQLNKTADFCRQTGLTHAQLEALLATEKYAPLASDLLPQGTVITPADYGAVFINAGQPAGQYVQIEKNTGSENGESVVWFTFKIPQNSDDFYDRVQRIIRLSQWLNLSFADTDTLLIAILRAQHPDAALATRWPDEETLRALGLFQRLRKNKAFSVGAFAALLGNLSVGGSTEARPFIDKVLGLRSQIAADFTLNNQTFNYTGALPADRPYIALLCGAFDLSQDVFVYLCQQIVQQRTPTAEQIPVTLSWSLETISIFYRLTNVARQIGIEPLAALALLTIFKSGSLTFVNQLIQISVKGNIWSDSADTLNVVDALNDTTDWLTNAKIDIPWFYALFSPNFSSSLTTQSRTSLFETLDEKLRSQLISEQTFIDAGIRSADMPWLALLQDLIIPIDDGFNGQGGIVKSLGATDSADYQATVSALLEGILSAEAYAQDEQIKEKLVSVLATSLNGQSSLLLESMASAFALSSEQIRQVIIWSGAESDLLLRQIIDIVARGDFALEQKESEAFNVQLQQIEKRALVVAKLTLSPAFLDLFNRSPEMIICRTPGVDSSAFRYAQNTLNRADNALDFITLYSLVNYRSLLDNLGCDESVLLDYFTVCAALAQKTHLSAAERQLLREDSVVILAGIVQLSVREILDVYEKILDVYSAETVSVSNEQAVAFTTVEQISFLNRLKNLKSVLNIGLAEIIRLGNLSLASDTAAYRDAAESALGALNAQSTDTLIEYDGEFGQSGSAAITLVPARLIANNPDENHYVLATVTLLDVYGKPRAAVSVRWETTGGVFLTAADVITDTRGQCQVKLFAGSAELGDVYLTARYSLNRLVRSSPVAITFNQEELAIETDKEDDLAGRTLRADGTDRLRFKVRVFDNFGNPATDSVLYWSTSMGTLNAGKTLVDKQGFAEVWLSAKNESGAAKVNVWLTDGTIKQEFHEVTVSDVPYFADLKVINHPGEVENYFATDEAYQVEVFLKHVDGSAYAGQPVTFSLPDNQSVGNFNPVTVETDEVGRACSEVTFVSAGQKITLAAQAQTGAEQPFIESEGFTVLPAVTISPVDPDQTTLTLFDDLQDEYVELSVVISPQEENYPVRWTINGIQPLIVPTDAAGISKLTFSETGLRKYTVAARVQNGAEAVFLISRESRYEVFISESSDWKNGMFIDITKKPEKPFYIAYNHISPVTLAVRDRKYPLEKIEGVSIADWHVLFESGANTDTSRVVIKALEKPLVPLPDNGQFALDIDTANLRHSRLLNQPFELSFEIVADGHRKRHIKCINKIIVSYFARVYRISHMASGGISLYVNNFEANKPYDPLFWNPNALPNNNEFGISYVNSSFDEIPRVKKHGFTADGKMVVDLHVERTDNPVAKVFWPTNSNKVKESRPFYVLLNEDFDQLQPDLFYYSHLRAFLASTDKGDEGVIRFEAQIRDRYENPVKDYPVDFSYIKDGEHIWLLRSQQTNDNGEITTFVQYKDYLQQGYTLHAESEKTLDTLSDTIYTERMRNLSLAITGPDRHGKAVGVFSVLVIGNDKNLQNIAVHCTARSKLQDEDIALVVTGRDEMASGSGNYLLDLTEDQAAAQGQIFVARTFGAGEQPVQRKNGVYISRATYELTPAAEEGTSTLAFSLTLQARERHFPAPLPDTPVDFWLRSAQGEIHIATGYSNDNGEVEVSGVVSDADLSAAGSELVVRGINIDERICLRNSHSFAYANATLRSSKTGYGEISFECELRDVFGPVVNRKVSLILKTGKKETVLVQRMTNSSGGVKYTHTVADGNFVPGYTLLVRSGLATDTVVTIKYLQQLQVSSLALTGPDNEGYFKGLLTVKALEGNRILEGVTVRCYAQSKQGIQEVGTIVTGRDEVSPGSNSYLISLDESLTQGNSVRLQAYAFGSAEARVISQHSGYFSAAGGVRKLTGEESEPVSFSATLVSKANGLVPPAQTVVEFIFATAEQEIVVAQGETDDSGMVALETTVLKAYLDNALGQFIARSRYVADLVCQMTSEEEEVSGPTIALREASGAIVYVKTAQPYWVVNYTFSKRMHLELELKEGATSLNGSAKVISLKDSKGTDLLQEGILIPESEEVTFTNGQGNFTIAASTSGLPETDSLTLTLEYEGEIYNISFRLRCFIYCSAKTYVSTANLSILNLTLQGVYSGIGEYYASNYKEWGAFPLPGFVVEIEYSDDSEMIDNIELSSGRYIYLNYTNSIGNLSISIGIKEVTENVKLHRKDIGNFFFIEGIDNLDSRKLS